MRRFLSVILALTIVLALSLPALAVDPARFTDIQNHWALTYIEQVVDSGLMNGIDDNTFFPNAGMSRAMFVTVLGRFAGINPDAWKMQYDGVLFRDVPETQYYSPYVNWAARKGIALGTGRGLFNPDAIITREQMITILQRFADVTGKTFQELDEADTQPFTDASEISSWARSAVTKLRNCGVIQGIPNDDGSLRFGPKVSASRAQAAAVFCRMQDVVAPKPGWKEAYVTMVMLTNTVATLAKGETLTLKAQVFPNDATNKTITWITSNPSVASVDNGVVICVGAGDCTIYAYSANGCKASCRVVCKKPSTKASTRDAAEFVPQDLSLAYAGEAYTQKCERIFGGRVTDPRTVYGSAGQASQNMVNIQVAVWDIGPSGNKYTRQLDLVVHRNIAATVEQIFREIYDCPAQYPIHSLGGYRYVSMSEHNCGLAIDINPNENYYVDSNGQAQVGSFFSPDTNEYSIPVGGEIDQIFSKYGFTRGIYWGGAKDYMHYSFFGT